MSDDKYQSAVNEAQINHAERSFGNEMSETEAAKLFGETSPASQPALDAETEELVNIYRIKARIGNAVAATGGSMTRTGEGLVNSFTHVVKAMYDFALTLKDPVEKQALLDLVKKHESMPADFIKSVSVGVKPGK